MSRRTARVAAWALLIPFARGQQGHLLARDTAACTSLPPPVPTTLSGYAAASSSLAAILPSSQDFFSCGYATCFNTVMSSWSAWEFGTMDTSPTTTPASTTPPSSTSTSSSSSSSTSSLGSIRPASNTSLPHLLDRGHDRPPYPSFRAAASSCCGYCQVWVGNAQVLWWPEPTEPLPRHAISTTVYNGVTITSPTVYVAYTGPKALDICGELRSGPTGGVIPVPTSDIKRLILPTSWASPAFGGVTAVVTPSDFAGCESATQGQYNFTQTVSGEVAWGDKCFPTLLVPTQIVSVERAWRSCVPGIFGMGDPPRALTIAQPPQVTEPPAVPQATTSPAPVAAPKPPVEAVNTPSPSTIAPTLKLASPPKPTPKVIQIESQAFTLNGVTTTDSNGASQTLVALAMASTTIVAGHSALTVNGNVVSLGTSELVVGSHTETFDPSEVANSAPLSSSSSSINMGDVVMSGLGQSSATQPVINQAPNSSGMPGSAMPTIVAGTSTRISTPRWGGLPLALIAMGWAFW